MVSRVGAEIIGKEVARELLGRGKADAKRRILGAFCLEPPEAVDEGLNLAHKLHAGGRRQHRPAALVEEDDPAFGFEICEEARDARDLHVQNEGGPGDAAGFGGDDERFPGA